LFPREIIIFDPKFAIMKNRGRAIVVLPLLIWGLVWSCSPCAGLTDDDQVLQKRFQALKERRNNNQVDAEAYRLQLNKLRARELEIFDVVRHCDLKDPATVQYWYNNRLKYPSPIEQELDRLTNRKWSKQ
jgi:hypothetical protein